MKDLDMNIIGLTEMVQSKSIGREWNQTTENILRNTSI